MTPAVAWSSSVARRRHAHGALGAAPRVDRSVAVCLVESFGTAPMPTELVRVPVEPPLDGADAIAAAVGPGVAVGVLGSSRGSEQALVAASTWPDHPVTGEVLSFGGSQRADSLARDSAWAELLTFCVRLAAV